MKTSNGVLVLAVVVLCLTQEYYLVLLTWVQVEAVVGAVIAGDGVHLVLLTWVQVVPVPGRVLQNLPSPLLRLLCCCQPASAEVDDDGMMNS